MSAGDSIGGARAGVGAAACRFACVLWLAALPAPGVIAADATHATNAASTIAAPAGDAFAVDHYTIDGGGGTSSGGSYSVSGTVGQADADPLQPSSGGQFEVSGGFWPAVAPPAPLADPLFANGFEGV